MQTKKLFFSSLLTNRHPEFWETLSDKLSSNKIPYEWLEHTKDIWCRDYMPVVCPYGKLVQFRFMPGYLKGRPYNELITSPEAVTASIKSKYRKEIISSSLILDGGNILFKNGEAFCTERLINENQRDAGNRERIINDLLEVTGVNTVRIVPEQADDYTGHIDSWMRWAGDKIVLNYPHEDMGDTWNQSLETLIAQLKAWGFSDHLYQISYSLFDNLDLESEEGNYLNFVELDHHILIPSYGRPEDDEAAMCYECVYPDKEVIQVPCSSIAKQSGGIHCITWQMPILSETQLRGLQQLYDLMTPAPTLLPKRIVPLIYETDLVLKDFDWMSWEEGNNHITNGLPFKGQSLDFCLQALTAIIRREYYGYGTLEDMCERGILYDLVETLYRAHEYLFVRR
jgi:agmatine deiminase